MILRNQIGFGENTLNFSKDQRKEKIRRTNQTQSHQVESLTQTKGGGGGCWLIDFYLLRTVLAQGGKRTHWGNPLQKFDLNSVG